MTNIEQKALELVNEVAEQIGEVRVDAYEGWSRGVPEREALCRAIEQHEAFRQEVSDAVEVANMRVKELKRNTSYIVNHMQQYIIAKPDPLEKLLQSIAITLDANDLREALDEAGLEIREKGNG